MDPSVLEMIRSNPQDDAPRQMMADWYEAEAGDPERAEFIRTQLYLASQGDHALLRWRMWEREVPVFEFLGFGGSEPEYDHVTTALGGPTERMFFGYRDWGFHVAVGDLALMNLEGAWRRAGQSVGRLANGRGNTVEVRLGKFGDDGFRAWRFRLGNVEQHERDDLDRRNRITRFTVRPQPLRQNMMQDMWERGQATTLPSVYEWTPEVNEYAQHKRREQELLTEANCRRWFPGPWLEETYERPPLPDTLYGFPVLIENPDGTTTKPSEAPTTAPVLSRFGRLEANTGFMFSNSFGEEDEGRKEVVFTLQRGLVSHAEFNGYDPETVAKWFGLVFHENPGCRTPSLVDALTGNDAEPVGPSDGTNERVASRRPSPEDAGDIPTERRGHPRVRPSRGS